MTYTLTDTFEVEVPKELRENLGLTVGDEVEWILTGESARIVRVPKVDEQSSEADR